MSSLPSTSYIIPSTLGTPANPHFLPLPPKIFTNYQWRQIAAITIPVILAVGSTITAEHYFGRGDLGALSGLLSIFPCIPLLLNNWPNVDYENAEVAKMIRQDLQTKSLESLYKKYSFSDLAYYGYISEETSEKMEKLYFQIPSFWAYDFKRKYSEQEEDLFRQHNAQAYSIKEKVDAEFNELRESPRFFSRLNF